MRSAEEVASELSYRIEIEIQAFGGEIPERYSLAWHGYLCGIFEWGIIDLQGYQQLIKLLPSVKSPNPIETIFSGRD
jgi:hypothetical protein